MVGRGKSGSHFHSWCYSAEGGRGVSSRFYRVFFVWIEVIGRQGESKISLYNSIVGKILLRASAGYNELLGRGVFRILPNIQDGVPQWGQPTTWGHWLLPRGGTTAGVRLGSGCASGWGECCRSMWGVCGLQVRGICSQKLIYKEVFGIHL